MIDTKQLLNQLQEQITSAEDALQDALGNNQAKEAYITKLNKRIATIAKRFKLPPTDNVFLALSQIEDALEQLDTVDVVKAPFYILDRVQRLELTTEQLDARMEDLDDVVNVLIRSKQKQTQQN